MGGARRGGLLAVEGARRLSRCGVLLAQDRNTAPRSIRLPPSVPSQSRSVNEKEKEQGQKRNKSILKSSDGILADGSRFTVVT
jgi:hypothetical protein